MLFFREKFETFDHFKTLQIKLKNEIQMCSKNEGIIVVENVSNELIPIRIVLSLTVCIDFHKVNKATRKNHFLSIS